MLITAGPTIEPIDPVRFMSNRSTGLLGYELARSAKKRKLKVTLITGPVCAEPPKGVRVIKIETARQLKSGVLSELKRHDVLIMAGAVCDFRPKTVLSGKIKRKGVLRIRFLKNPDILASIPEKTRKNKIIVGFALETENLIKNAVKKMTNKRLDFIIANKYTPAASPFGRGKKTVYFIDRSGTRKKLENMTKKRIAGAILDTIDELCYTRFI